MRKFRVNIKDKILEVGLSKLSYSGMEFEVNGEQYSVSLEPIIESFSSSNSASNNKQQLASNNDKIIRAPIPGIIVKCLVEPGSTVTVGQTLLIIEAMKMENNVNSTCAGVIKQISIKAGQEIEAGQVLIEIT